MTQDFAERCYKLVQRVPRGRVTTYAEIAHALGGKGYRAVGNALNKNPYAPEVPCHRVVSSSGRISGFAWGERRKIKLLRAEGIEVRGGRIVDFPKRLIRL
ncbi:MAG: MGMT family protein [Proteobacteria bacterium]|nr:MGMT family protein [Pseudomonadota bacterium]